MRVDANEMTVHLPGVRLRLQCRQKTDRVVSVLGNIRPWAKVRKEEPRQHCRHVPAAPPTIEIRDEPIVIVRVGVPNGEVHGGNYRSTDSSSSLEARNNNEGTFVTTIWNP